MVFFDNILAEFRRRKRCMQALIDEDEALARRLQEQPPGPKRDFFFTSEAPIMKSSHVDAMMLWQYRISVPLKGSTFRFDLEEREGR